jgi:hypothetical protein
MPLLWLLLLLRRRVSLRRALRLRGGLLAHCCRRARQMQLLGRPP